MHGGSDDGAGDEENCEDRRETSDGEERSRLASHTLTCFYAHAAPRKRTLRSARSYLLILILWKS